MNYKFLLASDMDYTFLLPSGEVSKANREALLELRDNGIAFTFATGRTHFLVSKYVFDLGIEVPVICSNGGEIFDYKKRKSVFSADFSDKKSRELLKLFFENNIDFTAYNSDAVYFSPRSSRLDFFLKYNEGLSEDEKAVLRNFDADILKSEELPGFNKFLMIESPDDFSSQIYTDIVRTGFSLESAQMVLSDFADVCVNDNGRWYGMGVGMDWIFPSAS